jgi:hypothetical protein
MSTIGIGKLSLALKWLTKKRVKSTKNGMQKRILIKSETFSWTNDNFDHLDDVEVSKIRTDLQSGLKVSIKEQVENMNENSGFDIWIIWLRSEESSIEAWKPSSGDKFSIALKDVLSSEEDSIESVVIVKCLHHQYHIKSRNKSIIKFLHFLFKGKLKLNVTPPPEEIIDHNDIIVNDDDDDAPLRESVVDACESTNRLSVPRHRESFMRMHDLATPPRARRLSRNHIVKKARASKETIKVHLETENLNPEQNIDPNSAPADRESSRSPKRTRDEVVEEKDESQLGSEMLTKKRR